MPFSQRRFKAKRRAIINAAKDKPCADCGGKFPAVVMDFDHRDPTKKTMGIGEAKFGIKRTLAEIAECDVVCANCHRLRTHPCS